MRSKAELTEQITQIMTSKWSTRAGMKVPEPEDLSLGNEGVTLHGAVLYADMSDSTGLVDNYKNWFAAEIYKSYLHCACEIIRNNSGTITSFDGDRVMAVFVGASMNSNAARAALQINGMVKEINILLRQNYSDTAFRLNHSVGVDSSDLLATRTGIRRFNDLVWIGSAANYAARLCGQATAAAPTVITDRVYQKLNDASKYGGTPRKNMWTEDLWIEHGSAIYRSTWHWSLA